MPITHAPALSEAVTPRRRKTLAPTRAQSHALYLALTAALVATVVVGFWPSYFGRLWQGTFDAPWFMHVHAAVFTGWMVLLMVQAVLAAVGRVRAHRRLGTAGIAVGVLLLIMGLFVSFAAPAAHVRAGRWTVDRAAGFMLLPLVDMVLFAGFFAAAIVYRRRPEIHKRLIISATVAVSFAAAARIYNTDVVRLITLWLAPIAFAAVFDLVTRRRVHAVWLISLAVFVCAALRVFVMDSTAWLTIGRMLLAAAL